MPKVWLLAMLALGALVASAVAPPGTAATRSRPRSPRPSRPAVTSPAWSRSAAAAGSGWSAAARAARPSSSTAATATTPTSGRHRPPARLRPDGGPAGRRRVHPRLRLRPPGDGAATPPTRPAQPQRPRPRCTAPPRTSSPICTRCWRPRPCPVPTCWSATRSAASSSASTRPPTPTRSSGWSWSTPCRRARAAAGAGRNGRPTSASTARCPPGSRTTGRSRRSTSPPASPRCGRRRPPAPCAPMPLVVLSHGQPFGVPADALGFSPETLERAWAAGQAELAALLPGARHVVAAESGHYVQLAAAGAGRRGDPAGCRGGPGPGELGHAGGDTEPLARAEDHAQRPAAPVLRHSLNHPPNVLELTPRPNYLALRFALAPWRPGVVVLTVSWRAGPARRSCRGRR